MRRARAPRGRIPVFPTPLYTPSRVVPSVEPEYARRDARAVEDPIAAIFDLAEAVDAQTPKIRKVLRYVRVFVSFWLFLDFLLMIVLSAISPGGLPAATFLLFVPITGLLVAMRFTSSARTRLALLVVTAVLGALQAISVGGLLFLAAILVTLYILGFVILDLMSDLRSFIDFFALRHRVIQRVRQADPIVYVPEGADAVQRILAHLRSSSPEIAGAMAAPGGLATPALLTGKSGLTYQFDAYVVSPPSSLTRVVGIGPAGFALLAKGFPATPTLADLVALKRAVEDVSAATRIPPARVLAVWSAKADESVAPDAYEFVTKDAVRVTVRGATYACSVELVREGADGTYDFIPVVVEPSPAGASGRTSAAA
jgi:hypothetical protein